MWGDALKFQVIGFRLPEKFIKICLKSHRESHRAPMTGK